MRGGEGELEQPSTSTYEGRGEGESLSHDLLEMCRDWATVRTKIRFNSSESVERS